MARADEAWRDQDIGVTGSAGGAGYSPATDVFTLNGAGVGLATGTDSFNFAYQALVGDGGIVAHVTGVQGSGTSTCAEVMIRQGLDNASPCAAIAVTATNGIYFQSRSVQGGVVTSSGVAGLRAPYWIEITRSGNVMTAFYSTDGALWNTAGSLTIPMPQFVYVGLAVSGTSGVPATGTFDNVNVTTQAAIGTGMGLRGDYFNAIDFSSFALTRIDPQVFFNWGQASPDPSIHATNFAIRWTGQIQPKYSEVYTFSTISDDGIRLWLDGNLLINDWTLHSAKEDDASIALLAGPHQITMEYYEGPTFAVAELLWQSASEPRAPVPMSQLYPASGPLALQPRTNLLTTGTTTNTALIAWDPSAGAAGPVTYDVFKNSILTGSCAGLRLLGSFVSHHLFVCGRARDKRGQTSVLSTPKRDDRHGGDVPAPWQTQDIGGSALVGAADFRNNQWQVSGASSDIWNQADQFRFVYQSLSGDGSIVARVNSQTSTDPWAKTGVMIRETLSNASANAAAVVSPGYGITFQERTSTGGSTSDSSAISDSLPSWVKMTRANNVFTGSTSTDGTNWTVISSGTISMAQTVYAGIVVSSHVPTTLCTAIFDNVGLMNTAPAGTGTGLRGDYFSDINFSTFSLVRTDTNVNFNWSGISPSSPSLSGSNFSVRWTGQVVPRYTDNYTFLTILTTECASGWIIPF